MKVLLVVKREDDVFWVEAAVDEFTVDDVGMPDTIQASIDRYPAETRVMWVEIPDGAMAKLWEIPTVEGSVAE